LWRRGKAIADLGSLPIADAVSKEAGLVRHAGESMRIASTIVLSSCLSGCLTVTEQQLQEKQRQFDVAKVECRKKTSTTFFQKQQCINEAENRIVGHESAIMAWKHAEFLKVALKLDRGEISEEEATIENQQVVAKAQAQAQQIVAQQHAVEAQRRAATSEAPPLLATSQPAASAPPPTPTVTQMQCFPNPFGHAGMTCNAQ
jgi:hypothetical protein